MLAVVTDYHLSLNVMTSQIIFLRFRTPEVVDDHPHLRSISDKLHPLQPNVNTQLLIGRDLVEAHQVLDKIIGLPCAPFAQRLHLGWVIIGDVCLGGRHKPTEVGAFNTHIDKDGRGTIFKPCENSIYVKVLNSGNRLDSLELSFNGDNVFHTTRDDDKLGLSVEDNECLTFMHSNFKMNAEGNWTAPLPFKIPRDRPHLPTNRRPVYKRVIGLDACETFPFRSRHKLRWCYERHQGPCSQCGR